MLDCVYDEKNHFQSFPPNKMWLEPQDILSFVWNEEKNIDRLYFNCISNIFYYIFSCYFRTFTILSLFSGYCCTSPQSSISFSSMNLLFIFPFFFSLWCNIINFVVFFYLLYFWLFFSVLNNWQLFFLFRSFTFFR